MWASGLMPVYTHVVTHVSSSNEVVYGGKQSGFTAMYRMLYKKTLQSGLTYSF